MLDLKTFLVLVLEMCGIAGFNFEDKDLVKKMCDSIWHRGPDDFGYYSDKFCTIGNRRLSIIDLKNGKQPIHNEDKTIWVVFNGEIDNFLDIIKLTSSKSAISQFFQKCFSGGWV